MTEEPRQPLTSSSSPSSRRYSGFSYQASKLGQQACTWWNCTTDRAYLVSPVSRRSFWKGYTYLITLIVCTCIVYLASASGAFGGSIVGSVLLESFVGLTCVSITARGLPHTSVLSDFVLATLWLLLFCRQSRSLPPTSQLGYPLLPVVIVNMWSLGMHSSSMLMVYLAASFSLALDMRVDVGDKAGNISVGLCILSITWGLEWSMVSRHLRVQNLLRVSTDGQIVVDMGSTSIVSVDAGAIEVLGRDATWDPLSSLFHAGDWENVKGLCSSCLGEPENAFLATMNRRPRRDADPTHEFEARLIPYEVVGHQVHFCLQLVGEVRGLGANQRSTAPMPSFRSRSEVVPRSPGDDNSASGLRSSSSSTGPTPSSFSDCSDSLRGHLLAGDMLKARQLAPDGGDGSHREETGTEISFNISSSAAREPREPVVTSRNVSVQVCRAELEGLPPLLPGLAEELASIRLSKQKKHRSKPPRVRLTSKRRLAGFAETPLETRKACMMEAMSSMNACGDCCCELHVSTAAARRVLAEIEKQGCRSMPLVDRQCPICFSMFRFEEEDVTHDSVICVNCGEDIRPLLASSSARSTSPASLSDGADHRVVLDRSGGVSMGIDVECDGDSLVVDSVAKEGLVVQWNSSHQGAELRRGDQIVEINGVRGDAAELIAQCQQEVLLEIIVRRTNVTGSSRQSPV